MFICLYFSVQPFKKIQYSNSFHSYRIILQHQQQVTAPFESFNPINTSPPLIPTYSILFTWGFTEDLLYKQIDSDFHTQYQ